MTTQNPMEELMRQFDEKVNEVRREVGWGTSLDSPVHEFGYKTVRQTDDGYTELFTVTDFGNVRKFILSAYALGIKESMEEVKRIAELYRKAEYGLDAEILKHLVGALTALLDKNK